jgi:hypothetical protein
VLKNSFQGISPVKFLRKLLNISSPQAWKFAEITGLVPFSTVTGDYTNYRVKDGTEVNYELATQSCLGDTAREL